MKSGEAELNVTKTKCYGKGMNMISYVIKGVFHPKLLISSNQINMTVAVKLLPSKISAVINMTITLVPILINFVTIVWNIDLRKMVLNQN